jgi:hypothetical protein
MQNSLETLRRVKKGGESLTSDRSPTGFADDRLFVGDRSLMIVHQELPSYFVKGPVPNAEKHEHVI